MLRQIDITEITRIIGLATAPAFLLGAVASVLSLLVGRLDRLTELGRELHADPLDAWTADHAQRLESRARSAEIAIWLCASSGVVTGWMIVLVFVDALFEWQNSRAIVLMFIAAMGFFTASLGLFTHELSLSRFRPPKRSRPDSRGRAQ